MPCGTRENPLRSACAPRLVCPGFAPEFAFWVVACGRLWRLLAWLMREPTRANQPCTHFAERRNAETWVSLSCAALVRPPPTPLEPWSRNLAPTTAAELDLELESFYAFLLVITVPGTGLGATPCAISRRLWQGKKKKNCSTPRDPSPGSSIASLAQCVPTGTPRHLPPSLYHVSCAIGSARVTLPALRPPLPSRSRVPTASSSSRQHHHEPPCPLPCAASRRGLPWSVRPREPSGPARVWCASAPCVRHVPATRASNRGPRRPPPTPPCCHTPPAAAPALPHASSCPLPLPRGRGGGSRPWPLRRSRIVRIPGDRWRRYMVARDL